MTLYTLIRVMPYSLSRMPLKIRCPTCLVLTESEMWHIWWFIPNRNIYSPFKPCSLWNSYHSSPSTTKLQFDIFIKGPSLALLIPSHSTHVFISTYCYVMLLLSFYESIKPSITWPYQNLCPTPFNFTVC